MVLKNSTGFSTYRTQQIAIKSPARGGLEGGVFSASQTINADIDNLEVDYDNNVTDLYRYISNSQWRDAIHALRINPVEAKTWVVRYHEDETKGMMWRFLPLHSACARRPPETMVAALIDSHPDGAKSPDDQGKYALHYASGNQASADVIRTLVRAHPAAAAISDPEGKLPLHWMAISGPSEVDAIQPLVMATKKLSHIVDDEGWTPLDYVKQGDYLYRQDMLDALQGLYSNNVGSALRMNKNSDLSPRHNLQEYSSSPLTPKYSSLPRLGTANSNNSISGQQSVRSIMTSATGRSTATNANKTVAKLNAQIVKLQADSAFNDAEREEELVHAREEYDESMTRLEEEVKKTLEQTNKAQLDLEAKERYIAYKEGRVESCEKELKDHLEQNAQLKKEIASANQEFRMERSVLEGYRMRIRTLSTKMVHMTQDQERINSSLQSLEDNVKNASDARREMLQVLFDDELGNAREMMEMNRMYGSSGPTIQEAMTQQKKLMMNCTAVLEECDCRDEYHLE